MPPPQGSWNPIEGPGDYTTTTFVHNDTYSAIDPTQADLHGKAVFISGASKGIGQAIAISFAKAGASYIALAARSDLNETASAIRRAAKEASRQEPKVLSLKLDVSDASAVSDAFATIEGEFGRLDILINNAGVLSGMAAIADSDADQWYDNFTVNLRAPYLLARSAIPLLLKSDLKTLFNIASVGAHCVTPNVSGYQTSKLAVVRLTEFIAAEYAEQGIVAMSIHPGNILTDIVGRGEGMDERFKAVFTETPELCADSLVYLAKERRGWLSGRYVNVTWDLPELSGPQKREEIVKEDKLKVRLVV